MRTWQLIALSAFATACADTSAIPRAGDNLNQSSDASHRSDPESRIKIISWNIANLAGAPGEALRGGYIRNDSDYSVLKDQLAALDPDIVALQEIGSIEGASRLVDTSRYTVAFESRCLENETACQTDTGDIYTAIAYKNNLPGAETFQMDGLAVDHTNECGVTRPVRGGVGVSFNLADQTVLVPSLHMKATCKDDRIEPGTEDDCETQKTQYDALSDWMDAQPSDHVIVLAGDFNRKLLNEKDSIRQSLDARVSPQALTYLPNAEMRTCWDKSDVRFDFARLKDEARANNPQIEAQNVDPFLYTPDANQEIDFFIIRGEFDRGRISSDQIELQGLYRFENPGNTITQCDGETILKFEGQDRALVFSEAYPSDHCPLLLDIRIGDE